MNYVSICAFHTRQREPCEQGSDLVATHISTAILVFHTAVNSTQWTEGISTAFVKPHDLERVDKVMVKYVSYVHSLLKENRTIWSMRRAGTGHGEVLCFCTWLEAFSMQLRVKESSSEWKDMHIFILVLFQSRVSNKGIQHLLMIWNSCARDTESLKRAGGSGRPWASLGSCCKNPGLCWLYPPHVQKLFPTMQCGFHTPWIS